MKRGLFCRGVGTADIPVSKTGGGNPVRVQIPPPALYRMKQHSFYNWTSELAYAIGLITTDGSLSKDKRHIEFTTTDLQLAKLIKRYLSFQTKIAKKPPSGFGKKFVYRINFGNVKLYKWLEKIGLRNNKTYSLGRLKIPNRYMADFLRGHLDGDGSVFTYVDRYMIYKGRRYTYHRLYTAFNSNRVGHLKWIQSNIKENLNIKGALSSYQKKNRKFPMWKLRFAKKESLKLLCWLYYKPDIPSLKRKRKIVERFLKNSKKL